MAAATSLHPVASRGDGKADDICTCARDQAHNGNPKHSAAVGSDTGLISSQLVAKSETHAPLDFRRWILGRQSGAVGPRSASRSGRLISLKT